MRSLTLWLRPPDVGYFTDALLDLAALAAERGARVLTVHSPSDAMAVPVQLLPSAVQYGWLQLVMLKV